MAPALSRRLSTATARVRSQVRLSGICDGQSGTGDVFLRVLPFPLTILIPPTAPQSLIILSLMLFNLHFDSVAKFEEKLKRKIQQRQKGKESNK
jgi:hypothetical protein